jgi:sugar phosphate isomerase/epimerase
MHEEMQKRTKLTFEIDTYWAYVAGRDPIEVMEQLKDRVSVIHIKDGTAAGKGYALGEGTAPVAAVHKKAIELGMLMVVESEGLKPTGPDEVGRCMQYLRTLDLGK